KFEASEIELRKPVVTLVLDGQGGGSWSSLAQRGPAGIAPAHVSFDSVRITDGTVTIVGADSVPRASFDRIDGELSAQALNGPYRLSAAFSSAGAAREIRLSTAQAAEDGSVRFKGTVRAPASGVSYSLDGLATDPLGQIKVTGALTAKLPLPAAMAASASGDAKPGTTDALNAASQFDVSAELRGDTSGFALSELSLSFEQAGRPQLATGSARVNWTGRTLVTVALKSQWLDLDRIAGAGTGGTPLELTQGVAASLSRVLASGGRTEASLEIEQATLGGDIVSGLTASLVESDGQLEVRNLSAALPGGARLSASGTFKGDMPDLGYSGRLSLRGASLARFAGWAGKSHAIPLPQRDGPFALVGDVTLGRSELAGRSLTIEVGRSVLSGDASWRGGPARQISLSLEGSELDLSSLVQAETDPARALSEIIAGFAGQRSPLVEAVASSNAAVKLRIDRLVLGSSAFTDVLAELRIADGALTMPMLRLASGEGYAVELKGDIAGLARPGAKGVLTGLVSANSAEGLAALVGLAGLPADLVRREENAALVVPVRLAGRMQVGLKGPNTLELTLDGSLAASRLAGTLRLGASGTSWRERQTDVAMTIEGPEVPRLIGRSLGGQSRAIERSARPARVSVRSIGTPRSGMTVLATIDGNGTAAAYQGRASIDDSGSLGLDGEAELSLADLADGLSLAGLSPRPSLDGPVAGSIRIERKAAVAKLASTGLKIANSMLAGTMTIESAADANRISGQLKLGEAGLSGLLALLSAQRPGAREAPARRSVWSESPLDLSLSDQFAGSALRFDVARLSVAPGLEIADARVELAAKPGRVEARLTDGNALGGKATATLSLEKAAAGAHLMSKGALAGIKLERLSARPGTSPSASGTLSARIEVQSTALSSRGLVVALTGSGEASLAQARLERWTPAAVGTAAEAVLALKGEIPPGALRTQLELALQAAGVSLGSQKVALTVADGALRAAPLVVSAPLGRLTGRAAVDLDQLLLDAEWRIEPRNTPPSPGLPP
ncbi:MAG: AsmA-like C-terminal region-containing protein, partial [Hyphomicrobiaceae bacterium]